jgi:hypothetical protein
LKQSIFPFYRNVNSEIRKFDDSLFILIEPQVKWDISLEPNKPIDPKEIRTYLPENLSLTDNFGQNGVLSFHYYDAFSGGYAPKNMEKYERDLKEIFIQLSLAASKHGLVLFLTEFGANQESGQTREHLNSVLDQIESNFLNFTILKICFFVYSSNIAFLISCFAFILRFKDGIPVSRFVFLTVSCPVSL